MAHVGRLTPPVVPRGYLAARLDPSDPIVAVPGARLKGGETCSFALAPSAVQLGPKLGVEGRLLQPCLMPTGCGAGLGPGGSDSTEKPPQPQCVALHN